MLTTLCLIVALLLAFFYAVILFLYWYGWRKLPEWKVSDGYVPNWRVSVVVPARNEANNIGRCLQSILDGSYPPDLLEVIVVDDHSTDDTAKIVENIQSKLIQDGHPNLLRLLRLSECGVEGKKMAIEQAVREARGTLMLTTDADCVVGRDWIRGVVAAFDPTPSPSPGGEGGLPTTKILGKEDGTGEMFGGETSVNAAQSDLNRSGIKPPSPPGEGMGVGLSPVLFHHNQTLLQRFQALDFLGLIGITGAGIQLGFQRMGNGANMAYRKSVFEAVGGYAGNEKIASGDDLFLIQKIEKRFPGSVFFLKSRETAVWTEAEPDWPSFWQQRLRWGAKNAALPEWPVRLILLNVLLFCWSIVLTAVLTVWRTLAFPAAPPLGLFGLLLFQVAVKSCCDWLFLREICRFFDRMDLLRWFWWSFVLHTGYIAFVGIASLWRREYTWKGRRTR